MKRGVNEHRKAVFRTFAFRDRMREFALLQRSGIKDDFTRVTHTRAVFQDAQQFFPADVRTVFRANLAGFAGSNSHFEHRGTVTSGFAY